MKEVRPWHIQEALTSFRRLSGILHQLTEEEVKHALALEQQSGRRVSIISRLTARLAHFHKLKFTTTEE